MGIVSKVVIYGGMGYTYLASRFHRHLLTTAEIGILCSWVMGLIGQQPF